jgi:hypothetical protein
MFTGIKITASPVARGKQKLPRAKETFSYKVALLATGILSNI